MQLRAAAAPAQSISAEAAAALVQSGMWLDYGGGVCQPNAFDAALAPRVPELHDIKIRNCISMRPVQALEADPAGERVYFLNLHFGGWDRKMHDAGHGHYIPVNLGEIPDYYRRFMAPVDIAIIKTCPPDADGFFNLSAGNLWHRGVIERAKTVIVEVCSGLPYCPGVETGIHASEVDYIIDGGSTPPAELPNPAPGEVDRAVASQIAAEIEDGACLQIGIGGMPNAVCGLLATSGVKGLGVHTEMLTDGIMQLYQGGHITGARKHTDPGKIVYTFALGSGALYRAMHNNPDLLSCPVDYTNAPHIIMQNPRAVAINSTTQVDLLGQAASETDGTRHISGTGGQAQFVRGTYAAPGGKSFICLPSTYDKRGARRSRIVPQLTPGNVVTTTRADMMYVVTEYGCVNLKGKSVPERARALIGLAHPDFREELERAAYDMRLIPRGFTFG